MPPYNDREVHFSTVTVRHYEQTLGDHPTCRLGPPVTLDWAYEQDDNLMIEAFEKTKKPRHRILSDYTRRDILLEKGFTESELRRATRQVAKIQQQRKASESELRRATREVAKIQQQRKASGIFSPPWRIKERIETAKRRTKRALLHLVGDLCNKSVFVK